MDYRTELLTLVGEYSRLTGRSPARVATIIQNQGVFFDRIRGGASCTVDTYLKVKGWFADHWPDGAPWPDGVSRPDVPPAACAFNGSPTPPSGDQRERVA